MASLTEIKAYISMSLRFAGIENSECRRETELIVEHATGWKLSEQILREQEEPSPEAVTEIERIIGLRKRRMPLQYCLGYTDFMGMRFAVREGVFIPRPDTEILVEVVLKLAGDFRRPRLLEIGAGSGAIAVSILKFLPNAELVAVDVSAEAVGLTRKNATTHGVNDRLITIENDWREVAGAAFDGIVSNPPYIPVTSKDELAPEIKEYEPAAALYGWGEDGLGFYRDLCAHGIKHVAEGGFVAVECGDGQAEEVAEIFRRGGLRSVGTHRDLTGQSRVISAHCTVSPS